MPKRSADEVLEAIERAPVDEGEEETERVLALSPEERRRELEAAGVDVRILHAAADALHARIPSAAGAPPVEAEAWATDAARPPKRSLGARRTLLLAAALALATAGGVIYVAGQIGRRERPIEERMDAAPTATTSPSPAPRPIEPIQPTPSVGDKPKPR